MDVYLAPNENENDKEFSSIVDTDGNLERVKQSITRIKKDLINIQLQQRRDRHRLTLHSETNETSHNRVIISSLVETAFFVAASLFQV